MVPRRPSLMRPGSPISAWAALIVAIAASMDRKEPVLRVIGRPCIVVLLLELGPLPDIFSFVSFFLKI